MWKDRLKQILKEDTSGVDTINMSVPLFIRMLEFAKEDAKTDMDLHKATENILNIQKSGTAVLDMDDYNNIVKV